MTDYETFLQNNPESREALEKLDKSILQFIIGDLKKKGYKQNTPCIESISVTKTTQQNKVLNISADLWNEYLKILPTEQHPDDTNDIRFHIHAIQNILHTQLYKLSESVKKK